MATRTSVTVNIRDRSGAYARRKFRAVYDSFGEVGYKVQREARKLIGPVPVRKNLAPRPPGRPARTRTGNIRHVLFDRDRTLPWRTSIHVGVMRFERLPQTGKWFAPGVQELGGWAQVWVWPDTPQKRKRKHKKKKASRLTPAQLAAIKRKARAAANAKWAARKAARRKKVVQVPKRPFMAPALDRMLPRIPGILRKHFRRP